MMRLQDRIDDLDDGVEQRNLESIMERAKFRGFQENWPEAWSDLSLAYAVGKTPVENDAAQGTGDAAQRSAVTSAKNVFTLWRDLNVASATPARTLSESKLIADELKSVAGGQDSEELKQATTQLQELVVTSLIRVSTVGTKDGPAIGELDVSLKHVLDVQSLCDSDHLARRLVSAAKAICRSDDIERLKDCLLYTSPSPRDATLSRMPSSA